MTDNTNKFPGKLFLVKVVDPITPGTYRTVAGMRGTEWTLNNEHFDVTDKDNMPCQQLISGGVQKIAVSLSGIMKDAASLARMLALAVANTIVAYQVVSQNGDVLAGNFAIKSFGRSGPHTDAESYTLALESAGDFTYTAPPVVVDTILPPSGSTFAAAGGDVATIHGSKLQYGATCTVAGGSAIPITVAADGMSGTFVTPAHVSGTAAVIVTNADGQAAASKNITYA